MNFRYWQHDPSNLVVFQALLYVLVLSALELRLRFVSRGNDIANRNTTSLRLQDTWRNASHLLFE